MTDYLDMAVKVYNSTEDQEIKTLAGYVWRCESNNNYARAVSPFTKTWLSTVAFHNRFRQLPPEAEAQMRCVEEEVAEVRAEIGVDKHALAGEIADVIVTLMGVAMAEGVELAKIEAAMHSVVVKNDSKTHETHHVNGDGKIARLP